MEILEIQEEAQSTNRELLEQAEELENRLATERAGQAVAVAAIVASTRAETSSASTSPSSAAMRRRDGALTPQRSVTSTHGRIDASTLRNGRV